MPSANIVLSDLCVWVKEVFPPVTTRLSILHIADVFLRSLGNFSLPKQFFGHWNKKIKGRVFFLSPQTLNALVVHNNGWLASALDCITPVAMIPLLNMNKNLFVVLLLLNQHVLTFVIPPMPLCAQHTLWSVCLLKAPMPIFQFYYF